LAGISNVATSLNIDSLFQTSLGLADDPQLVHLGKQNLSTLTTLLTLKATNFPIQVVFKRGTAP